MTLPPLVELGAVVMAQAFVAWAGTYLAHSTLLIVGAWLLDERLIHSSSARAAMWRTALFGALLTAPAQLFLPRIVDGISAGPHVLAGAMSPRPVLSLVVVTLGSAGLLVGLLRLARGQARLRRAVGPRGREDDALDGVLDALDGALDRQAAAAGLSRAPRLTSSARIASPAAIGLAEICFPEQVLRRFALEEQEGLLAHELGHVARRDPVWLGAAATLAAILFFQPLNRLALRRLREASELAADEFAVRHLADRAALARALAALAPLVTAGTTAGASASGSPLLRRVRRILRGPDETGPAPRRWRALAACLAALTFVAAVAPGISASPDVAGDAIPWLAPSSEEPGERMIEVRRSMRRLRHFLRSPLHPPAYPVYTTETTLADPLRAAGSDAGPPRTHAEPAGSVSMCTVPPPGTSHHERQALARLLLSTADRPNAMR
ncbi:MAG: M56 family metallopeptidase [Gemmatimonadota bacterium]